MHLFEIFHEEFVETMTAHQTPAKISRCQLWSACAKLRQICSREDYEDLLHDPNANAALKHRFTADSGELKRYRLFKVDQPR